MQPVDVKVDQVKFSRMPRYRFEENSCRGHRVRTWASEPQRAGPDRVKLAACAGVPAREQSYVMTEFDQFIYQPSYYALSATVKFGRNAFGQRGNLGNPLRKRLR